MMLLSSSSLARRLRSRSAETWITSPASRTTALRYGGEPVSRLTSPRNRCAPVDRDDPVLVAVALDDRDRARLDQEEVVAGVALAEQDLAGLDLPHGSDRAQPRPLLLVEPRKRAVAVDRLLEAGAERLGHQGTTALMTGPPSRAG